MKLWLDDVRAMPHDFDLWAISYDEAIDYLNKNNITYISFDHDLGGGKTGYDLACVIEHGAHSGKFNRIGWDVHSANPVGKRNIEKAMTSAERWW